jgi:uncharacterized damage-inducible protein DinB
MTPIGATAMLGKDDLGRLLEYTTWANRRVLRAAAALTVEEFKRDLGASHGGVRGTLAHVLSAEWLWLERWKGVSPPRLLDEGEFPDVVALSNRWKAVNAHREAWFRGLAEPAVAEIVRYRTLEGKASEAPLWQLVQHLANHSSYHRGQVAALLRQLGAAPATTDMVAWDRKRAGRRPPASRGRAGR